MRLFLSLVLFLGLSTSAHATNNLINIEGADAIQGASQVYDVYKKILMIPGFANQAGHSMAAGVLARCLGDKNVIDHVRAFQDVFNAMKLSSWGVIRNGAHNRTAQMTYAAATLTCRRGRRSAGQLVTLLDASYSAVYKDYYAILKDSSADSLANAVAAAELVN